MLNLNVKRVGADREPGAEGTSEDKSLLHAIEQQDVEFAGFIPADELIFEYDLTASRWSSFPPIQRR